MNKSDFKKGITLLEMAYNQTFTNEKIEFWWSKLNILTGKEFINKINELVEVKKFMPSIAEILEKKKTVGISGFEQRDYSDFDFNSLIANKDEED